MTAVKDEKKKERQNMKSVVKQKSIEAAVTYLHFDGGNLLSVVNDILETESGL